MGAYHARKLRPMATVNPEVIRGRVATVKLSRRRYHAGQNDYQNNSKNK